MDSILSPPHCCILAESFPLPLEETSSAEETEESKTQKEEEKEEVPEFETITENFFQIQLCTDQSEPHYVKDLGDKRIPLIVIFNSSSNRLLVDLPKLNYKDIAITREANDPIGTVTLLPGCL